MFCFNIHFATPPHWGSWHSFFQFQCLCRADLLFSFSGLDTSERFFIAKCCHQEWAAHACSRFARVLLTLAHALLTVCSRFRVLLSPYEVPFGSLRGCAHGLLTVCSRFARAAHALLMLCSHFGGLGVYHDEETQKQTMPLFCCSEPCVRKAHSFQAADSLRLIFKSEKNAHMPFTTLRWSGVTTPLPQPEMYVQRSLWA